MTRIHTASLIPPFSMHMFGHSFKRTVGAAAAFCLLASGVPLQPADASFEKAMLKQEIAGRYIVRLKNGSSSDKLTKVHGIIASKMYAHALKGFSGELSSEMLKRLRNDPNVLSIEPDIIVTAYAQTVPTGIKRIETPQSAQVKIDGVNDAIDIDVAIIDTGIDLAHPDLNVYRNVNTISKSRNGNDDNGHGTHVAGTVAAKDNDIGVVGVAPGARLWAVKVLGKNGSGYMSDIIEGIDYVTAHADEIEVANMSLGCECVSAALNAAIGNSIEAGVTYVVAAGNSSKDAANFAPANHPDVIAVSAIADFNGASGGGAKATCYNDVDDTFANFSNYGSVVDIAAPGTCIYSTWKGKSYSTVSGTSMASPHVAGAAALYIAKNGKPVNAADVAAVKTGLLTAAFDQDGPQGFNGDPDDDHESFLNVTWESRSSESPSSSSSSSSFSSASSSSSDDFDVTPSSSSSSMRSSSSSSAVSSVISSSSSSRSSSSSSSSQTSSSRFSRRFPWFPF